jgi:8-amino-7-oxononanoate synthase
LNSDHHISRIEQELEQIRARGLYRRMRYFEAPQGPRTRIDGRDVLVLSSNNYLGLCNDERLKSAAIAAIEKYGVGSGGSRLLTGSYDIHRRLEGEIANLKGTEACLVFNTGYMANLGAISTIADKDWVIFSDSLNHASIIDGCRMSGARVVIYNHCDLEDLHRKTDSCDTHSGLIVTDGVFSIDGDIAPLPEILDIARNKGMLVMVDDAHATGVLGPNGAGTADYYGLQNEIDIQMGTLSKALASEGGYVAGKRQLIELMINRARSFIFTTALAPATIAVSLKALDIVKSSPEARQNLIANSIWFQERLRSAGFNLPESRTAILSIILGDPEKAVAFSAELYAEGIYIPAIRPPTVPSGTSRLRISLMATHTREDLEEAALAIEKVGRNLRVI